MKAKKIAIASDHAGYELKEELVRFLTERGYVIENLGTYDTEPVDYPEYGHKVALMVSEGECERGILICGSGVGMAMVANKVKGVRAACCSEPISARMSRAHNDSNVLTLGARLIGVLMAKEIVEAWLNTEFEGGRHQRRVDMINKILG